MIFAAATLCVFAPSYLRKYVFSLRQNLFLSAGIGIVSRLHQASLSMAAASSHQLTGP
jgi:hypothetical protein